MIRSPRDRIDKVGLVLAILSMLPGCKSESLADRSQKRCVFQAKGESLFVGKVDCLKKLKPVRMSGLWVLGHEYSVFYENASKLPPESDADAWLEADPSDVLRPFGFKFDGRTQVYKVDFIGTKSDAKGIYGYAGTYKRGALVLRMLSVKLLPKASDAIPSDRS